MQVLAGLTRSPLPGRPLPGNLNLGGNVSSWAEMSHFGTIALDRFDQTASTEIRRSACFWPAGSTPASSNCRAAWRRARALSIGT